MKVTRSMNPSTLPNQSVPAKDLSRLLRRALISASADEGRVNLCHVRIEPATVWTESGARVETKGVKLISTDGHRLSTIESDLFTVNETIMLHRRAVECLLLMCKLSAYVLLDEGAFHAEGMTIKYTAPDWVSFPPWGQVCPSDKPTCELVTTAGAFSKTVRATEPTVGDRGTEMVCLGVNTKTDPDLGVFTELDKGTWVSKSYLLDALRLFSSADEIRIGTRVTRGSHSYLNPITIETREAGGTLVVVMPLRP